MMKTFAAIDIGSNTVQFQLAEYDDSRLIRRESGVRSTRLGAADKPGHLSAEAIAFTAKAVAEFMNIAAAAQAETRIIATSATRDAQNSDELRQAIRMAAPAAPEIEIISGRREAELSYLGARSALDFPPQWPVADIGGASSELIFGGAGKIFARSINVGAVRAARNGWDRAEIARRLREGFADVDRLPADASVVGVGGCITTAAGIAAQQNAYDRAALEGMTLTAAYLAQLAAELAPLSREQRCRFSPLLEKRGEIMLEGLYIWLELLATLGAEQVLVTGGGLPDGAIAEMRARRD